MEVGFPSLDNRITLLQEMLIRDREDRLTGKKKRTRDLHWNNLMKNPETWKPELPYQHARKLMLQRNPVTPIKILQWNARGLYRSRLEELKNNLRVHNPHIVLLSETHWRDQYNVKFSAYKSFSLNRLSQGGGVAILILKNIQAAVLDLPSYDNLELIGVTIKLKNNQELDVVSVYCPNGSQSNYEDLETILNNTGNSTIVGGDLNAHSELWEDGYPTNLSGRNLKHYILNEAKFLLATPKNLGTRPIASRTTEVQL